MEIDFSSISSLLPFVALGALMCFSAFLGTATLMFSPIPLLNTARGIPDHKLDTATEMNPLQKYGSVFFLLGMTAIMYTVSWACIQYMLTLS